MNARAHTCEKWNILNNNSWLPFDEHTSLDPHHWQQQRSSTSSSLVLSSNSTSASSSASTEICRCCTGVELMRGVVERSHRCRCRRRSWRRRRLLLLLLNAAFTAVSLINNMWNDIKRHIYHHHHFRILAICLHNRSKLTWNLFAAN